MNVTGHDLACSLPGGLGLQGDVMLPFILLHQCANTPVGGFNLLIHTAVSGINNHRMSDALSSRGQKFFWSPRRKGRKLKAGRREQLENFLLKQLSYGELYFIVLVRGKRRQTEPPLLNSQNHSIIRI